MSVMLRSVERSAEYGPLHPTPLQGPVRGLAEGGLEGADEVRLRHVRDAGQGRDVERLGVRAVHASRARSMRRLTSSVARLTGPSHHGI
jgi:hypothetical protein